LRLDSEEIEFQPLVREKIQGNGKNPGKNRENLIKTERTWEKLG